MKDIYFTIDSDKLINSLIKNKIIEKIGVGSRYKDEFNGLHNDKFKADNTFNWEIMEEDEEAKERKFYNLSNNFDLRELDNILVLSKHVGTDIRGGYEDDIVFIKNEEISFYEMIYENLDDLDIITKDKV